MSESKEYILTPEGKEKLEAELNQLKNVTRKEVSAKIKEARSFGDLSENAEYDAAKDEQAEVEARINTIEHMLKYAKVVDVESNDIVTVGKKVHLRFYGEIAEMMDMAGEAVYTIVGSSEADPSENKLSFESPIGAVCINKSVGDEVVAETPAGEVQFTILNIEKTV
ncbi:MAG: transcription elongation factor GreA [Clostridia bacterium]|nr:transcription elongation factor GreA [Clostridia bacterium]